MYRKLVTLAVGTALLASVAFAGCSTPNSTAPPAPQSNAQAVKGGQLVQTKCKMCHSLDRVYAKRTDRAGWEQTVTLMQSKGTVLTDEEKAAIIEYLSTMGSTK